MKKLLITYLLFMAPGLAIAKDKASNGRILQKAAKVVIHDKYGNTQEYLKVQNNKITVYNKYGITQGYYGSTTNNNKNFRYYSY